MNNPKILILALFLTKNDWFVGGKEMIITPPYIDIIQI